MVVVAVTGRGRVGLLLLGLLTEVVWVGAGRGGWADVGGKAAELGCGEAYLVVNPLQPAVS